MNRHNWRVSDQHSDITPSYPFAVVNAKGTAVALVASKPDADFIASAPRIIAAQEENGSRMRAMYLGASMRRR
jgi:hypothetical protein